MRKLSLAQKSHMQKISLAEKVAFEKGTGYFFGKSWIPIHYCKYSLNLVITRLSD